MFRVPCKYRGVWIFCVLSALVLTSWYGVQLSSKHDMLTAWLPDIHKSVLYATTSKPMEPNIDLSTIKAVHIAITVCGERMEQALVMLKSAVIFTKTRLIVHVFAEDKLQDAIKRQIDTWPAKYRQMISLNIYNTSFPDVVCKGCQIDIWKKLFHPCAAQRLFYPSLLPHVDSVIHLDTDTLLFTQIEKLWALYSTFNSTQSLGAAMCRGHGEDPKTSTIVIDHYVPYYGDSGLSSGVMLMNLTRLRASTWAESMGSLIVHHGNKGRIGDQDFINAYGAANREEVYVLPYEWNYLRAQERPQDTNGNISILHATSSRFHLDICLGMKALHSAFKAFELGKDDVTKLEIQMSSFQKYKKKCDFKLVQTSPSPLH